MNKHPVSGPPTTDSYFEKGASINSEVLEEGKMGYVIESRHLASRIIKGISN